MIVVDASVIVDLLLDVEPSASVIQSRVRAPDAELNAPHLLDAEVGHALRGALLHGRIGAARASKALEAHLALPIERHGHRRFLPRAFQLRDHATVYDALYLALAEGLGATLVTRDRALATVPGVAARVEVIAPAASG